MPRFHEIVAIGGAIQRVQYTADEETARDVEEQAAADAVAPAYEILKLTIQGRLKSLSRAGSPTFDAWADFKAIRNASEELADAWADCVTIRSDDARIDAVITALGLTDEERATVMAPDPNRGTL